MNYEYSYLLVYLGFIANVLVAYSSSRLQLLLLGALTSSIYGVYSYLEISLSGAFISALTITNILYQASVSEEKLELTKQKRLAFASVTAIIGSIIIFSSVSDIFPLLAFLSVCFANCLKNHIIMLKIYAGSALCWALYGLTNADTATAISNGLMIFIYLQCIYVPNLFTKLQALYSTASRTSFHSRLRP